MGMVLNRLFKFILFPKIVLFYTIKGMFFNKVKAIIIHLSVIQSLFLSDLLSLNIAILVNFIFEKKVLLIR